MTYEINEINSADIEWFGGCMEDDAGYLRFSAVHAWIGNQTLCGATPRGEITDVSSGDECKRCLKKVAKIEQAEEAAKIEQVEEKEIKAEDTEPETVDQLIARRTGFSSLNDMLNARGGYRPSCDVSDPDMHMIANAYDVAQTARGDERRAFRY